MSSPIVTTAGSRSISSKRAWRIASSIVTSGITVFLFRDAGGYRDDAGAAAFGLAGCVDLRAAAVALARRRDLLGRGRRERAAESLRWSLVERSLRARFRPLFAGAAAASGTRAAAEVVVGSAAVLYSTARFSLFR